MAAVTESTLLLGRPGNHLKMGIVGYPNVGKSTLFNCLTQLAVPASNFPFCTIEPNESRVEVPDARYDWLVEHFNPVSKVPAYLQVTDIAGLIRGASEGLGLGNAFLSHIRAVDGIYHVCRVFEDETVSHVEGDIDPVRDITAITNELRLKDLELARNLVAANEKACVRKKDKELADNLEMSQKFLQVLEENTMPLRFHNWNAKEVDYLNELQFLTAKPVIYLVNMTEADYARKKNKHLPKIFQWVKENSNGELIIPFSGQFEAALLTLTPEQRTEYIRDVGIGSALPKIIVAGYEKMDLIHYFTCGADEVKCWTIRRGTKAPAAAGVIHSDFEKGFICADVMEYDDYKELGSENACKGAGKYHQHGKTYVVKDGDICFFKFNTASGGKPKK